MTIIYVPRLIESAEQAEALDWKTPVQIVLNRTQEVHDVKLFEDFAEDFWPDALEPGNRWGYVALVPIEAEEEHGGWGFCAPGCERIVHSHYPRKRLATPWEEA